MSDKIGRIVHEYSIIGNTLVVNDWVIIEEKLRAFILEDKKTRDNPNGAYFIPRIQIAKSAFDKIYLTRNSVFSETLNQSAAIKMFIEQQKQDKTIAMLKAQQCDELIAALKNQLVSN